MANFCFLFFFLFLEQFLLFIHFYSIVNYSSKTKDPKPLFGVITSILRYRNGSIEIKGYNLFIINIKK